MLKLISPVINEHVRLDMYLYKIKNNWTMQPIGYTADQVIWK